MAAFTNSLGDMKVVDWREFRSTAVSTGAWGWSSTKLSPDGHGGERERKKNVGGRRKEDSKSSVLDLGLGMRSWAATSLNV